MTAAWQAEASSLVDDLLEVFGQRLRSVVAYGPAIDGIRDVPLSCLALVSSLSAEDLDACARRAARWARAHLGTPLILPEAEFLGSLDAFPLEYGEIVRAHADVYGTDPFLRVVIAPEDLRRACETQIKSHLLHLRESFIETGGTPRAVADLVRAAAPALAALLRHVARLGDRPVQARDDATRAGARLTGVSDDLVAQILAIEAGDGQPAGDLARLFPEYLAAVEQVAHTVDAWRV